MFYLATDQQAGSSLVTFLPLILIVAAVYFLMIRPQSKRRKDAQQLQSHSAPVTRSSLSAAFMAPSPLPMMRP